MPIAQSNAVYSINGLVVWCNKRKTLFCSAIMKKNRKPYSIFQKVSSIFLMLTLLWLTVSTPFIISSQEELSKSQRGVNNCNGANNSCPLDDCSDETNDGGANNNIEEKVPTTNNLTEEFLHEYHHIQHFISQRSQYHKLENSDTYTAFHGELLVPPPNVA